MKTTDQTRTDICGLCGMPYADKIPHPVYWPGEIKPNTEFVHLECERIESEYAMRKLSQQQRAEFLKSL